MGASYSQVIQGNAKLTTNQCGSKIAFNCVKSICLVEKNKNLRKTSMKDAVIDLFTCVHADKFMGSDWSSYSGLINNLRKTRLTK